MLTIRKVLFPTDFSEIADEALAQAVEVANSFSAELQMIHIVPSRRFVSSGWGEMPSEEELERLLEKEAHQRITALEDVPSGSIRQVMRRGDAAAPAILDHAKESDVDLIVMATHGRRGIRKWLLGSVAEEVVRRAECPVMTLRRREHGTPLMELERILCPIDFSDHSRQALRHGRELAALSGAELQLLHVLVSPTQPAFYPAMSSAAIHQDPRELRERAEKELEGLFEEAGGPAVTHSVHSTEGEPVEKILEFSTTSSSDLIVMASHGLTGLSHFLLGSVAERVIQGANRPVLTIKSFGKLLVE